MHTIGVMYQKVSHTKFFLFFIFLIEISPFHTSVQVAACIYCHFLIVKTAAENHNLIKMIRERSSFTDQSST